MKYFSCILVLGLLLLASCGAGGHGTPESAPVESSSERYCTHVGGFDGFVCRYELQELLDVDDEVAVQVQGYLHKDSDGLYLSSNPSGGGESVRFGRLEDKWAEEWFVEAVLGHLSSIRGIYRPDSHVVDVRSLRWVEEAGMPAPKFPPPEDRN